MDMNFNSIQELYKRIYPALSNKKRELIKSGYNYIKEEDIWNYLKINKWSKSEDLSLSEMVNDVLYADKDSINNYLKNSLKERSGINE